MEYLIAVIGLCFFIVPMWAYRQGLKDGLNIQRGKPIEPIKSPVQVVKDYQEEKQAKVETDKLTQGLQNILSYTGDPQKEGDS